jgi:hypothetical protein
VIPDEIEQTVSEYASQRIDIRAGNALISADSDVRCPVYRVVRVGLPTQAIVVGTLGPLSLRAVAAG